MTLFVFQNNSVLKSFRQVTVERHSLGGMLSPKMSEEVTDTQAMTVALAWHWARAWER